MKLTLWTNVLWAIGSDGNPIAFCPDHRNRLDVIDRHGRANRQDTSNAASSLECPVDAKRFALQGGSFWAMQRRFLAAQEAITLKDAEIVSLDGYQIPIAKAIPPEKDSEYWAEARINDTKRGKQLVVYAGKRGERDKAQMFLDVENDKVTFDQNNQHPNDVFTRVTAEFRSGRKTTME